MNYIMLSPLSLVLSNNNLLRVSEEDEVPLLVASYEAQGNVERIRPAAHRGPSSDCSRSFEHLGCSKS